MNGLQESSSTNSDETSRSESISSAQSLLISGKKHLLLSTVPAAVSDFAEACELLAKVYGETAVECGESYYYYGKALLELSRLESGVLGNALGGVDIDVEDKDCESSTVEDPDKLSKDEKLEVEDQVAEALEENFENHDRVAKIHSSGGLDEEEEDMDEDEEECKETEGEEVKTEEKAEEMEDEDPGNLQLAWEMLELAKVVYSKAAETSEGDSKAGYVAKLCESLLCLGEVSLENENYSQAIADFTECLNLRSANLPPDSRSIAETHYQLGVAHALDGKYEESEPCLNNAICVLEKRIEKLGKMETSENLATEIEDLHSLVADIKEKINDHKTMAKALAEGNKEESSVGFTGTSDNKPVSSIGIKKDVDISSAKESGCSTVGSA